MSERKRIQFTIFGRPQQRGSKEARVRYNQQGQPITKNGRVLTFALDSNKSSRPWMDSVKAAAREVFGGELLQGPIILTAAFYFARPKSHYRSGRKSHLLKDSAPTEHAQSPDLSKLMRCLEDAITGQVWHDDRLVCRYGEGTGKFWTEEQECCEVTIETLGTNP